MSTKLAAAISTEEGECDSERDTAFAMDCLLPWTKELLNSGGGPTIDSFEAFRWLDARAPGVYACLAIKKDIPGRVIELRWLTLAVGIQFIRETQADEYLAAWYYQLEAMLASALGSLDEKSNDYKFRGMQWWPFDPADTTEAWKGADHHCSIRDIWAKRPTMRTEDEIAEREAAARVVETTRVRKQ